MKIQGCVRLGLLEQPFWGTLSQLPQRIHACTVQMWLCGNLQGNQSSVPCRGQSIFLVIPVSSAHVIALHFHDQTLVALVTALQPLLPTGSFLDEDDALVPVTGVCRDLGQRYARLPLSSASNYLFILEMVPLSGPSPGQCCLQSP